MKAPEIINGKVVKRWFSRGKARIPVFEDGTIGIDNKTDTRGETREQYRRYNNAFYQGHTKEYYEHIEKQWENKMKTAKDTKEYNFVKGQRDAWQANRMKAVAHENMANDPYDNSIEDKSASKMIDYNAKTRAERYRNYNTTDPNKANANIMAERKIVSDWENGAITDEIALKRFNGNKERATEVFESMGYHSPFKDYGQAVDIPGFENYQYYPKTDEVKVKTRNTKTYNLKTSSYFGENDLGEWEGKDFEEAKQNFLKENPSYANGKYGNITGSEVKNRNTGMTKQEEDSFRKSMQEVARQYEQDKKEGKVVERLKQIEDDERIKRLEARQEEQAQLNTTKAKIERYKAGKNKKDYEKYNDWLKEQGINKQITEKQYNEMSLGTQQTVVRGLERSIEMEKDNLARRKNNGDSVESISNMTNNIHKMELELQSEQGRLNKIEAEIKNNGFNEDTDIEFANRVINEVKTSKMDRISSKADMEIKKETQRIDKRPTISEVRKELRNMNSWSDEKQYGNIVVTKTGNTGYHIRNVNDVSDPMTDYFAGVYGVKEKQVLKTLEEKGFITNNKDTKATIERFKERKGTTRTNKTPTKRELAEKIVDSQIKRGIVSKASREMLIKSKMNMSKEELEKYFK